MSPTSRVRATDGMLTVGDRELPFVSGEVQFWRMSPESWRPALEAVADLGIPVVSTYLSWRRHEPEHGTWDWGTTDPRLDVRRFVELCAELGLLVQLKPGPWICAEEPGGGYPDWVLAQDDLLARDHAGAPVIGYNPPFLHPVPSLRSPDLLRLAGLWFDKVWDVVGDLRHPHGPIVALQLDNEPSQCFQHALYFSDYHPAVVDGFREWLAERYGDEDAWRKAWAADDGARLATVIPPAPPGQRGAFAPEPGSPPVEDWSRYGGAILVEYLARLERMHDERGCANLLTTVNIINPPVHEAPLRHVDVARATRASVGVDHYYVPPIDADDLDRLAVTAATARAAGDEIVWSPELMAGIWRSPGEVVTYPSPTPLEQELWWGSALAYGYQGFNLYMLVDRENWEHAPIGNDGVESEFAAPVRRLLERLRRAPELLRAAPHTDVQVAWHYPDTLAAYQGIGTAREPEPPWADARLRTAFDTWWQTLSTLRRAGYSVDLWDTAEAAQPDRPVLVPPHSTITEPAIRSLVDAGLTVLRPATVADVVPALRSAHVTPVGEVDLGEIPSEGLAFAAVHERGDRRFVHLVLGEPAAAVRLPVAKAHRLTDLATGQTVATSAAGTFRATAGHHVFELHPA